MSDNPLKDLFAGVVNTLEGAADALTDNAVGSPGTGPTDGGFVGDVLAQIPRAVALAAQQLPAELQPVRSFTTASGFSFIQLVLNDAELITANGKFIQTSGEGILYRRQGSAPQGVLQLIFPSGKIDTIYPGTFVKASFESFFVRNVGSATPAANAYANLIAFQTKDFSLIEAEVISGVLFEPIAISAHSGVYQISGYKRILVELTFAPDPPTAFKLHVRSYDAFGGSPYEMTDELRTVSTTVAFGTFAYELDIAGLNYIGFDITNVTTGGTSVGTVSAVYGVQ